jgi:glycosyltransferase involved in cell wall biosynthesis
MPAYNEEAAIADAVSEVKECVLDRIAGAQLIVVDDGSRDNTGAILDEIAAKDARIHVIHKRNAGHGPAILTGLSAARGVYVLLLDSDRQIPLDSFAELWDAVQSGRDGAFGVRRHRNDPTTRLLLAKLVRFTLPILFSVDVRDANVPFKLLRRSIWLDASRYIPDDTLAPSLFLSIYMARRDCDVAKVDVPHRERETGVVSIRRLKLLAFCWRAFGQMLAFRRRLAT